MGPGDNRLAPPFLRISALTGIIIYGRTVHYSNTTVLSISYHEDGYRLVYKDTMKTPIEVLIEELASAILAAMDLTDNELTVGDIIAGLETTKLEWYRTNREQMEALEYD